MEILVVDANSDDRTVEFAQSAGARVLSRRWTNFVDARSFALAQVTTPWALMIDADEALDDVLCKAILAAGDDVDGYVVRRTTYFCGKALRLWRNEPLLRLFRRDRVRLQAQPAAGGDAILHEGWVSTGTTRTLNGTLLHYSYPDVASYRAKYDRYTSLEAEHLAASPAKLFAAICRALARFAWLLTARGALLDGPRGWYVAYRSAMYPAVAMEKALLR
jgi:glycosyltransferase involved in cell wall biosynthesis